MGTPAPVVPVLHRLHSMPEVELVAALTPPDRPRGRGRQPEPPPVKEAARQLGIPVLQPPNLRGDSIQSQLAELAPEVIVVAAYGRLLPPTVLDLPPRGCLNIHPSLLPRHRGPSPVATAILEGDAATGVSLMLLDEGMDTGPVIARSEVPLDGTETSGELTNRLFDLGGQLLETHLGAWVSGELEEEAQDHGLATVTRKLERADGLIDWNLPAEQLARKCRAFSPWPGLYTEWEGRTLKVLEASAVPYLDPARAPPGRVVASLPPGELNVTTGGGLLTLKRVQLEGRRAVTAEEFVRGYPEIAGASLGPSREIDHPGELRHG